MVKCRYKDVCTSYPIKCGRCANNEKRDYYRPRIVDPITPWKRWESQTASTRTFTDEDYVVYSNCSYR